MAAQTASLFLVVAVMRRYFGRYEMRVAEIAPSIGRKSCGPQRKCVCEAKSLRALASVCNDVKRASVYVLKHHVEISLHKKARNAVEALGR